MIWYKRHVHCREDDFISARLLKLCLVVGGLEDAVRVLDFLSKPHTYELPSLMSTLNEPRVFVIGIRGLAAGAAIASVVERHEWISCEALKMEMLKEDRVADYGEYFAVLALEVQKLECKSADLLVGERTLEPTYLLEDEVVVSLGKTIFCKWALKFAERTDALGTDLLCRLVVQIHAEAAPILLNSLSSSELPGEANQRAISRHKEIVQKSQSACYDKRLLPPRCFRSLRREFVRTFCQLNDEQLFDTPIQEFLRQSNLVHKEQRLLKELLDPDGIWEDLTGTVMGRTS